MLFKFPVVDSHVHMMKTENFAKIKKIADKAGYEQYTLLGCAAYPVWTYGNLAAAWAKLTDPERIYVYAMPHEDLDKRPDPRELLEQVKCFHAIGFDGIKLADGKPDVRKRRGIPLDDACYDPMFAYLEQMEIPVVYHSNDPVEFWDKDKVPKWAAEYGVLYPPEPSWKQIRDETIGILKKHPRLHLTIAHMFFLSNGDNLELAEELLLTYPNLMFDVTPGWEMFEGFGMDMKGWRSFFLKYADRIVFGTDMNGGDGAGAEILNALRRCLETDEIFEKSDSVCHGLYLPDEVLMKIYKDTYKEKIQPKNPRVMNKKLLEEYQNGLEKYLTVLSFEEKTNVKNEIEIIWNMITEL